MKIRWIGCKEKFSKIYPFNTSLLNRSNQASKGRSRLFQRQAFNCARIFKDPFFTVVKWNHSNPKKKKREKRNVRISLSVGSHNHPDRWGFLILKRITISEKKEISPKLSSRTSSKFFDSNKSSFREFERDYFNYSQLSLIEISRSLKNRLIQKLIIYSQNTSFFFIHKNWIPSESRHSLQRLQHEFHEPSNKHREELLQSTHNAPPPSHAGGNLRVVAGRETRDQTYYVSEVVVV